MELLVEFYCGILGEILDGFPSGNLSGIPDEVPRMEISGRFPG